MKIWDEINLHLRTPLVCSDITVMTFLHYNCKKLVWKLLAIYKIVQKSLQLMLWKKFFLSMDNNCSVLVVVVREGLKANWPGESDDLKVRVTQPVI